MTTLDEAEQHMSLDTDECDVCGHVGDNVEWYPTVVPMVGSFDMPLCAWCARLGTSTGDST